MQGSERAWPRSVMCAGAWQLGSAVLLTQGLCMTEHLRWSRNGQCSFKCRAYMSKTAMLNENVNEMNCVCKCVMKCVLRSVLDYHGSIQSALKETSVCMRMKIICIYYSIWLQIQPRASGKLSLNRFRFVCQVLYVQPYWIYQSRPFQVLGCNQLPQRCVQHVLLTACMGVQMRCGFG